MLTNGNQDQVYKIIKEAQETPFYKEVLIPELDRRLAAYDELIADKDPWRRYAFVEAYLAIKALKLALENIAPSKQTPVFKDGPVNL